MLYKYRKLIAVVAVVIIVVLGIGLYIQYLNSVQKVTVTFNTTDVKKLELYKGFDTRNVIEISGDVIQTIESGKEYTLSRGLYALKPTGDNIKTDLISLRVGDTPVKQNIDIGYTAAHLQTVLKSEDSAIQAAITKADPRMTSLYKVAAGSLYHHGEWYGAVLVYAGTDSLSRDTLRFVMKKEGNDWKLVTTPPQLSLSSKTYKDIPVEVIKAVNAIDIGLPTLIPQKPTTFHAD